MKYFSALLIFLTSINLFAQEERLLELKQRLSTETDREKIETYLDISEVGLPVDTNLFYLNLALKTADRIKFDSIFAIEFAISINHYVIADYVKAKLVIRNSLEKIRYTRYPRARVGHVHMLLGAYCEAENEIDSALYYYDLTKTILETDTTIKGIDILSSTYQNQANIFLKSGEYEEALPLYFKSLEIDKSGNYRNHVFGYNNIAGCYKELQDYEKAIHYYEKAVSIANQNSDDLNKASALVGLAESYQLQGRQDEAKVILIEAKDILEPIGYKEVLNVVYQHMAEILFEEGNIQGSLEYSQKALDGVELIADFFVQADVYLTKAAIDREQKLYTSAIQNIDKSYSLSKSNGYLNVQKESVEEYIKVYDLLEDYKALSQWRDTLRIIQDSIINIEHLKVIENAEKKYQSEKKRKENVKLKSEIKKKDQRNGTLNYLLAIGGIALLVVIYFLMKYVRSLSKERKKYMDEVSKVKILKNSLEKKDLEEKENLTQREEKFHNQLQEKYQLTDAVFEYWLLQINGIPEKEMQEQLFISAEAVKSRRRKLYDRLKEHENIDSSERFSKSDSVRIYRKNRLNLLK
jgi:tetratricopeptide (TPR) repeat protein